MGEVWESVLGVAESEKRCVEVKKGVGKCIGVQGK